MKATSPPDIFIHVGDLVTGNFSNASILTYDRPPFEDDKVTRDVRFRRDDVGVVVEVHDTPESFYSLGSAKVVFSDKVGWIPFNWLRVIG